MPFITEEIYHQLRPQSVDLCISIQSKTVDANTTILAQGNLLKQVITALRDARNKNQIKPKESIVLYIQTENETAFTAITSIIAKQVNAASIVFINQAVVPSIVVAIEKDKFYIESEKKLDTASLQTDLIKDLAHQQNFLSSVQRKLSNEKFVQNANPNVLAMEQKKLADTIARIKTIEESLATLQ